MLYVTLATERRCVVGEFEKVGAVVAVSGLLIFVVKWLLGSFVERLSAIEVSLGEVNEAVNNVHEKHGPDAKKLYDLTLENHSRAIKVEEELGGLHEKCDKMLSLINGNTSRIVSIETKCQQLHGNKL